MIQFRRKPKIEAPPLALYVSESILEDGSRWLRFEVRANGKFTNGMSAVPAVGPLAHLRGGDRLIVPLEAALGVVG